MPASKTLRPSPSAPGKELPDPPAADATADKTYVLSLAVTGDDTVGGSTSVMIWVEYTADLTP
jgi:hypothetical protein